MNETVTRLEAADIAMVLKTAAASLSVSDGRPGHRHPGDEHGIGIKNVTINEPHFQGHFPGNPVFPAC